MSRPMHTGTRHALQSCPDEALGHAEAWLVAGRGLDSATALDEKTLHLATTAVLAAMRLVEALPLHVQLAREAGASRIEVASAVLVGLPAGGTAVLEALPVALQAYDAAGPAPGDGARAQAVRPARSSAHRLRKAHSKRSASIGSRREAFRAG
jgi:alkylhydroperoxidase/carboxymuconolactone decarboxylase family protein YurZ